jgi:hypothetical protein
LSDGSTDRRTHSPAEVSGWTDSTIRTLRSARSVNAIRAAEIWSAAIGTPLSVADTTSTAASTNVDAPGVRQEKRTLHVALKLGPSSISVRSTSMS